MGGVGAVGSLEVRVFRAATEPEGAAISITLSAISASVDKAVLSGVEARTMRTLWGNLCKNSSCRNDGSIPGRSPTNCYIRQSNCVGFLSPNSSPVNSCGSRRCSDRAVRLVSCSFNVV